MMLRSWGKQSPSPSSRVCIITCMLLLTTWSLFGCVWSLMKKHQFLPSLSFWQPHSSQLDPWFDLQPSHSQWRALLDDMPTGGISLTHSVKLVTLLSCFMIYDSIDGQCPQNNWHPGSKVSWIWNEQGHLNLVITPYPFHLNPSDNLSQGSGEEPAKATHT